MDWQAAGPGTAGGAQDPFSAVEAEVRAMVAAPWWPGATPQQRTEAVTSHMLSGAGEWWLFGAWGRWYRCGLDGHWYMCPPPSDAAARRVAVPAARGGGTPPVPPQIFPMGPDAGAGRVAAPALLGTPDTTVVARVQQALITALSVNPAQFALRDTMFPPGTPSTVAAAWGALLWCAGSPVALAEHPLIELFVPYLTAPSALLRWMVPPDLSHLTAYYGERLIAGDGVGASHLVRVMHEVAMALRGDPGFRPGADALAAITSASLPLIQHDMAAARYGPAAVTQEWRRRCPPEYATTMVRETTPGEFLRLGLYDLTQTVSAMHAGTLNHGDARQAAVALLAADLQGAPHAAHAVSPWLDPGGARTLQAVLSEPAHPLRTLWPGGGRLPEALRIDQIDEVRALLATAYAVGLTWCRLAQMPPPAPGFAVPAAAAAELSGRVMQGSTSSGTLTPWQIIEAARAHLATERGAAPEPAPLASAPADHGPPSAPVPPVKPDASLKPPVFGAPDPAPAAPPLDAEPPAPPFASPPPSPPLSPASFEPPSFEPPSFEPAPFEPPSFVVSSAPPPPAAPEPGPAPEPEAVSRIPADLGAPAPDVGALIVEAYGTRFLSGPDQVDRLLTEVRRRGKWAQRLRGQEVSSGSAPALLLLGAPSSGQRRLTRMVARALADAEVSSGDVHTMHAEDLRERDPEGVRGALGEHSGHTLLLERLDTLVLDDPDGPAYADALYRSRVEAVSDTTLVATCGADRMTALSASSPELVTDFRVVRLPEFSDPALRAALLGLLAAERQVALSAEAWEVARRDLAQLRGRGRFTNARVIEVYLDRACTNQLSRAGETRAIGSMTGLVITPSDLQGIVEDLSA